jgi:hypothetical protein
MKPVSSFFILAEKSAKSEITLKESFYSAQELYDSNSN